MLMRGVQSGDGEGGDRNVDVMCVIETDGGVASPGPSGTLQCDLYRYVMLLVLDRTMNSVVFFFPTKMSARWFLA